MTILAVALLSFAVQGILWIGENQGEKRAKQKIEQSREVASDKEKTDDSGTKTKE